MLVDLGSHVVNTDHIVSIEPSATGHVATLTNGKTVLIRGGYTGIEELCGVTIPAPPGFTLVEAFLPSRDEADGAIFYRRGTIIAFRTTLGSEAPIPITMDGQPTHHGGTLFAVIDPTGRCTGPDDNYETVADFRAACEQARADRQRRAPTPEVPGRHTASFRPVEPEPEPTPPEPAPAEAHREPTAVEKLRATIQAEPIAAPFADAPWRPGRDLAEVIDEVRHAHPDLHAAGVGYSPKWGWKWGPGSLERERAEMTAPGNVKAFEASLRFLSHAGRQFAQQRVNRNRWSYSWKHAAERIMGVYVPNGMLIAAAYALGFTVEPGKESSNACINLSEKAIALDPGKGMT